jgi:hypothetical protein
VAPAVVEDKAMSAREFRDDDVGYLAWLAAHPDGYVINIARSQNATEARVCTMPVAGRSAVRTRASARGPDRR